MDIVRYSIARPVTIAVGVILIVMFGLIGFGAIPIQLTPNVDEPIITVETGWTGRTPEEIIDEIVKEQEEVLKNLNGLKKMTATASEGASTITLEFFVGTDPEKARTEVSDSLRQVPDYPDEVDEPVIQDAENTPDGAITWIILDIAPKHREAAEGFDITTLLDAIDRRLKPELERVDGVAVVNVYGGREREMRVEIDNEKLALLNLNHLQVLEALRNENRNVSAGTISEGKRDYRVRVIGQFASEQDILDTVITYRDGDPVFVKDVAVVRLDHVKRRGFVRSMGNEAIAINAIQRSGSNVMKVMEGIRGKLDVIKEDVLPGLHPVQGKHLRIRQVYDETVYINSAISLVTQNLWVGGGIAILVLLVFLRSFVATGVIALAIPISVIGTFLVLLVLGRTLNVISLAGLAFAVGMVVDNGIVVLENIDRHRAMGKPPVRAAYEGGKEVWGAVLASTLTTVAVFVPILTIQEEAGQLFRDISLAIVASVSLSLLVSITVIPAACAHFFGERKTHVKRPIRDAITSLFGLAPTLAFLTDRYAQLIGWLMTGWRGWTVRPAIIAVMAIASLVGAVVLMPPADYLPAGNKNLVFGGLLIPPGYSVEQREMIAERIEAKVGPYLQDPDLPAIDESTLADIVDGQTGHTFNPVRANNFFIGAFGTQMFCGGTSINPERVKPIGFLLSGAMSGVPDSYGGAGQSSLFGRSFGGGTAIDVEILGPDLAKVTDAMNQLFNALGRSPDFGYTSLRGTPSNFNLDQPETRVHVSDLGLELGLRPSDMGTAVRALFDGAYAGDFQTENKAIDIRLLPKGGSLEHLQQLADIPIATPAGPIVPMESLIRFDEGTAPQEIVRVEELPAIRLAVTLPDGMPVAEGQELLESQFIAPLRASGAIDRTMQVRYEGTAAKLDQVYSALLGDKTTPKSASVRTGVYFFGIFVMLIALGCSVFSAVKATRAEAHPTRLLYGAIGFLCLGAILAGLAIGFGTNPQLVTARFIWALVVTYLLMCALFESFVYPFVVMFSVPLAVVGGFAGLSIVHKQTLADPLIGVQNLDVLTMLGFVILVGIVVNNAILIVHQSLNYLRGFDKDDEGNPIKLGMHDAVIESVRTRIRPVFMSTLTSVGGMLPLVLFPGAGSELYRGLGSVVVGGLMVSTVFTLMLVPLTLSLVLEMTAGMARVFGAVEGRDRRAEALAI